MPPLAIAALVLVVSAGIAVYLHASPPHPGAAVGELAADASATTGPDTRYPEPVVTGAAGSPSSMTIMTDLGSERCRLEGFGELVYGKCSKITASGLMAGTEYAGVLYVLDGSGRSVDVVLTTLGQTVEVYWDCPPDRTFCREQGGELSVAAGPGYDNALLGPALVGERFDARCYEHGQAIDPSGEDADGYWDYHPGKEPSDVWIRIDYDGQTGYIPFVWVLVKSWKVNSLGALAAC